MAFLMEQNVKDFVAAWSKVINLDCYDSPELGVKESCLLGTNFRFCFWARDPDCAPLILVESLTRVSLGF
jgi:hypothetical protein